jgi:hypothetical protein
MDVRVVRSSRNVGPGVGRNELLNLSTAGYVHWHDADDFFFPSWSDRVRRAIEKEDVDAVFTEVSSYSAGVRLTDSVLGLHRLAAGGDLVRFCIRGAMLPSAGTYRRGAVERIGGYRPGLWQSEDFDFAVRLAASGIRYALIDEPLVGMNLRPDSRSRNRLEVWRDALLALSLLAEELPVAYRPDLSERTGAVGSKLYELGDREAARRAFRLACELSRPTYAGRSSAYRAIARTAGPMAAEHVARAHRTLRGVLHPSVKEP